MERRRERLPYYLRDMEGLVPKARTKRKRSSTNGNIGEKHSHKTKSSPYAARREEDQTIIRKLVPPPSPRLNKFPKAVEGTNGQESVVIRVGGSFLYSHMLCILLPFLLMLIGALLIAKFFKIDSDLQKKRPKQTIRQSLESYLSAERVVYISKSWQKLHIVSGLQPFATTEFEIDACKEAGIKNKRTKKRRKKKKASVTSSISAVKEGMHQHCPTSINRENENATPTISEDECFFLTPINSFDECSNSINSGDNQHFPLDYATPMKFEDNDWKAAPTVVQNSPFLTPPRRKLFDDDAVRPHSKSPFGSLTKEGFSEQIQSVKSCMLSVGMNEEEAARKACDHVLYSNRQSQRAEIELQNRQMEYEIQVYKHRAEYARQCNRTNSVVTDDGSTSGDNEQGAEKMFSSAQLLLGCNFKYSVALGRTLRFLVWYSATKSLSQAVHDLHNIPDMILSLTDQVCGCTNHQSDASFTYPTSYIYYFLPEAIESMWMSSIPRFMCMLHWASQIFCVCFVHSLWGKFHQNVHLGLNQQFVHDVINIAWMLCIDDVLRGIVKPLAMFNILVASFIFIIRALVTAILWMQGKCWRRFQFLGMPIEKYVDMLVKTTAVLSYVLAIYVGYHNPIV